MPIPLSAESVRIAYSADSDPAIRRLDLEIRSFELLAVVGPNGSGKSTLVRSLSRVLRPVGGAILLNGRDLYSSHSARSSASEISVVAQTTHVAFEFTVREVVEMGRMPYLPSHPFAGPQRVDRDSVEHALSTMAVAHLQDRPVTTLSGGEQQRVMIARALAQEPDVLLLDEPTAHLDIQHQLGVLALCRRLAHKEGKAVLVVLHDLNLAAAYSDRMALMKGGELVASGTPAEVLSVENIEAAYGTRVWLRNDPASGRPYVTPLPEVEASTADPAGLRVHVIAGGGTGAALLLLLCQLGCTVTMGVLNAGDTDREAADALGIPYASEKPFTAISEQAAEASARLASDADVVVVTDVPFGPGNLANLEQAVRLRKDGKRVVVQAADGRFDRRDFTGGAATSLWNELLGLGVDYYPSPADIAKGIGGLGSSGGSGNG
jgi:iron complex transport system ATP-binding protein